MKHEKIFKRTNGYACKIIVSIRTDFYDMSHCYKLELALLEPKKRKWKYITVEDDYRYRRLPVGSIDREKYILRELLQYASITEIQETALELWEKLKPTFS